MKAIRYIEYKTQDGLSHRAIKYDTRYEIYQLSEDLWGNRYWRFLLPISIEQFEQQVVPKVSISRTLEDK